MAFLELSILSPPAPSILFLSFVSGLFFGLCWLWWAGRDSVCVCWGGGGMVGVRVYLGTHLLKYLCVKLLPFKVCKIPVAITVPSVTSARRPGSSSEHLNRPLNMWHAIVCFAYQWGSGRKEDRKDHCKTLVWYYHYYYYYYCLFNVLLIWLI